VSIIYINYICAETFHPGGRIRTLCPPLTKTPEIDREPLSQTIIRQYFDKYMANFFKKFIYIGYSK